MSITASDVAVFAAELLVYALVASAAWRYRPGAVGGVVMVVASVAVMALWWGTLHSPKAVIELPRAADLMLRVGWFAMGAVAGCAAAGRAPQL